MKVPFENIEVGVVDYLDHEFLSQYPDDSFQRVLIGMGISLILKQKLQELHTALNGDLFKTAGIVDNSGLIDLDLLRDSLKAQMSDSGIRYENRILGTITFHKEDVDTLYKYLTAIR